MRRALVVGIDYYEAIDSLRGCVNDAYAVKGMLERNADGSVNFGCKILIGNDPGSIITRTELKEDVRELFAGDGEVALLYFAGHGYIETRGGYLCAGDCRIGQTDRSGGALAPHRRFRRRVPCGGGGFAQSRTRGREAPVQSVSGLARRILKPNHVRPEPCLMPPTTGRPEKKSS